MYTVDGKNYYFTSDLAGIFDLPKRKVWNIIKKNNIGQYKVNLYEFTDADIEKLRKKVILNVNLE